MDWSLLKMNLYWLLKNLIERSIRNKKHIKEVLDSYSMEIVVKGNNKKYIVELKKIKYIVLLIIYSKGSGKFQKKGN